MNKFERIARFIEGRGMSTYFVGGCVRDAKLGLNPDDIDICIVGGNWKKVSDALEEMIRADLIDGFTTVHGSFPIWIVEFDGKKYEFALARVERKIGETHQSFECSIDNVTIEQDLLRRDLTINAMAMNVLTREIIDPYGGAYDLNPHNRPLTCAGIANPVSEAFKEDALRVIRAARFIARFDLEPSGTLLTYSMELSPDKISKERIGTELMKLFKKPGNYRKFFDFLNTVGWLEKVFPEVYAMIGIPQSPVYHPEGDVYVHTMHCIQACKPDDWFTKTVMLCHDMAKVDTTLINGVCVKDIPRKLLQSIAFNLGGYKISAPSHEEAGVEITRSFLKRIFFCDHKTINRMSVLVSLHMIKVNMNEDNKEKLVRRTLRILMHNELTFDQLAEVVRCDLSGRPPQPALNWVNIGQDIARRLLDENQMEPIVTGELLLKKGMKPSPVIGDIVKRALDLQDRGTLTKKNWMKVLKGSGFKKEMTLIGNEKR